MKVTIELGDKLTDPMEELEQDGDCPEIKTLADLRKLLSKENPRFTYGGVEFGAKGKKDLSDGNDTTSRKEGIQKTTPDDKAEEESNEKRIKNSDHPTIVGKKV